MTWPTIHTDTLEAEKLLADYLASQTAASLAAHKFWPGPYDDFSGALLDAGWRIVWEEHYWFAAQRADGGPWLEYIEGDLYHCTDLKDSQLHRYTAA